VLLVLAGLGVALAGVLAFRRARTTVNPMAPQRATAVVRTGLYRLSRNPMYLGLALALLGLAAWGSSLTGYALVAGVLRIPDPVPDQARRARPAAALRARICRLHGPGAALDLSSGPAGGHPGAFLMKKWPDPSVKWSPPAIVFAWTRCTTDDRKGYSGASCRRPCPPASCPSL
jgi:hypothetical protein